VYYQHSSHTKSKTQQPLGQKLTLSQPKPGHIYILMLLNKLFTSEITQSLSAAVPETRSRTRLDSWFPGEQDRGFWVHELVSPNKHKASKALSVENLL